MDTTTIIILVIGIILIITEDYGKPKLGKLIKRLFKKKNK